MTSSRGRRSLRWSFQWLRRPNPRHGASSQYLSIAPDATELERKRFMHEMDLTREQVGLLKSRLSAFFKEDSDELMIWMLQKNSSLARRVRAVSATEEQMHQLNADSKRMPQHKDFAWSGHRLLGDNGRPVRVPEPEFVHALVELHHRVDNPNAENRVKIVDVYVEREYAERAQQRQASRYPDVPWAVITYPVGQVLF